MKAILHRTYGSPDLLRYDDAEQPTPGDGNSLLFFGVCCILFGYLIHKSGYLPKVIGVLLVIGGVGYVAFSLAQTLAPAFAGRVLFPWIMLPAFLAELGLALWLLVKGVNLPRWEERARGVRARRTLTNDRNAPTRLRNAPALARDAPICRRFDDHRIGRRRGIARCSRPRWPISTMKATHRHCRRRVPCGRGSPSPTSP